MTLDQAKDLAAKIFPEIGKEVLSSESLVRKCYNCYCLEKDGEFEVYGDDILIGHSVISPEYAWEDAVSNLPDNFLRVYQVLKTKLSLQPYYRRLPD